MFKKLWKKVVKDNYDKLKALFVLKKEYGNVKEAYVKSGLKTSEFWLTLLLGVISLYGAVQGIIDPELAVKIAGVTASAYAIARAITKATATTKDDEMLDKIVDKLKKNGLLK